MCCISLLVYSFFKTSLFRDEMTSLSSSYNILGLVPACWLLFQCFGLKPAKIQRFAFLSPVRG